jgi:hypothetical protein
VSAQGLNAVDINPRLTTDPQLLPDLRLEIAEHDAPALRALRPDDDLYWVAAWAFHHAGQLRATERRGLWLALRAAWPRKQSRPNTGGALRAHLFAELADGGVSAETIAAEWHLAPNTVRKLIRRGRAKETAPAEPKITPWRRRNDAPVGDEPTFVSRLGPPDPGTVAGVMLLLRELSPLGEESNTEIQRWRRLTPEVT